jgi:hypothetical protein
MYIFSLLDSIAWEVCRCGNAKTCLSNELPTVVSTHQWTLTTVHLMADGPRTFMALNTPVTTSLIDCATINRSLKFHHQTTTVTHSRHVYTSTHLRQLARARSSQYN